MESTVKAWISEQVLLSSVTGQNRSFFNPKTDAVEIKHLSEPVVYSCIKTRISPCTVVQISQTCFWVCSIRIVLGSFRSHFFLITSLSLFPSCFSNPVSVKYWLAKSWIGYGANTCCIVNYSSMILIGFLKRSCKMFSSNVLINTSCTVLLSLVLLWFHTTMWF